MSVPLTEEELFARWPLGTARGQWTILGTERTESRRVAVCRCGVCGIVRHIRPNHVPIWHVGCSAPRPSVRNKDRRRYHNNDAAPCGASPLWAEWSAELHCHPELREEWPLWKSSGVDCWRSNQVADAERMSELASVWRGAWLNGVLP